MLYRGYNGTSAANLTELLTRAAQVSLLMQSPAGEWPTGGRSSQHQWNEGVLCALFEMRANIYKQQGNMVMVCEAPQNNNNNNIGGWRKRSKK